MSLEDGRVCSAWHRVFNAINFDHVFDDAHLFPDASLEDVGSKCRYNNVRE